jgi:hypothetical protein
MVGLTPTMEHRSSAYLAICIRTQGFMKTLESTLGVFFFLKKKFTTYLIVGNFLFFGFLVLNIWLITG